MQEIKRQLTEAIEAIESFVSDDRNLHKIALSGDLMIAALNQGKKIISCGNGGSMCDAMHFAEELMGKFRENRKPIAAIAISDPSYISCTANDFGYDEIFSRFVQGMGNEGDILLAISTSGNSANVMLAIRTAKLKGMKVIGLTGKDGGKMAGLCDIEIRAPHSEYADRAQEIHIKIIHSLIDYIERTLVS